MQNTQCACSRGASVTRPAVRPSRARSFSLFFLSLSLSPALLFFLFAPSLLSLSLPGVRRSSEADHPSWILMDGDSRTRGRIPADADPQEGRMRPAKIAAWGGINFRPGHRCSPLLLPPFLLRRERVSSGVVRMRSRHNNDSLTPGCWREAAIRVRYLGGRVRCNVVRYLGCRSMSRFF